MRLQRICRFGLTIQYYEKLYRIVIRDNTVLYTVGRECKQDVML